MFRSPPNLRLALLITLLASYALPLTTLDHASLWTDEAWSIWVAQEPWPTMLQSLAADVHPPLYFALLKGWIALTGESVFATRLLSTTVGLIGLAITFALGRRWLGQWAAIGALLWLGTHGFLLYYLREARMYSLLLALAALAMWSYNARRPWAWLGLVGCTAALLYTHYLGVLILAAQALHLLWTAPRRLPGWLAAVGLGVLLFLPWLPTVFAQVVAHPGGPHLTSAPSDWAALRQLLWIGSGGAGPWLGVGLGIGLASLIGSPVSARVHLGLIVLWISVPTALLLASNAWVVPLYELRNLIGVLPAVGLLVGWLLNRAPGRLASVAALVLLMGLNLAHGAELRPPKTPWGETITELTAVRRANEPLLLKVVEPASLEAYYSRTLPVRTAATIDLSGRSVDPQTMVRLVQALPTVQPVWLMMPTNIGETWSALAALQRDRGVGWRRTVDYLLIYRFDPGPADVLHFTFGQQIGYAGGLATAARRTDQPLCVSLALTALTPVADNLSFGLHLVDETGRLVTQVDQGLGAHAAGAAIKREPCLTLPANLAARPHYLHLVIYRWADGARLPVQENGLPWGDALVILSLF